MSRCILNYVKKFEEMFKILKNIEYIHLNVYRAYNIHKLN